MGLVQQTIDCQCNGRNPNCSICDGKGYYYRPLDDENNRIKKTESEGHILDLNVMRDVKWDIPDYQPELPRRKKRPSKRPFPDIPKFGKPKKAVTKNEDIIFHKQESNLLAKAPENLVRSFPELRKFFKYNEPTHKNLERLLLDLSSIYKDKEIHSAATAFIKLEMLKMKLDEEKSRMETGRRSLKKKCKKVQHQTSSFNPNIPNKVSSLSRVLNIPIRSLLKTLEQKSIYKQEEDSLTEFEINVIKPFVSARLQALKRQKKRRLW